MYIIKMSIINSKTIFTKKKALFSLLVALVMSFSASAFQNQANVNVSKKIVLNSKQLNKVDDSLYGVPKSFTEDLKRRTFNYFWEVVDTTTWQTNDRYPSKTFISIAATGFALPSYIIGIDNSYITRKEGAKRVLSVLEWLWKSPQGPDRKGNTGYKGFYYHFLNYGNGTRYKQVELSTIDTALLMAGVLTVQSYFDKENIQETKIRQYADSLYRRVDWQWAMNGNETMSMGWYPEKGFIKSQWKGYNEGMILLILGLGSPDYPISENSWETWTSTYDWEEYYGYEHINFGPLFGHQYSQMFVDFRGIKDEYMTKKGIDYFENSKRATLANRAYAISNPNNFVGYSKNLWGLTASDGPANTLKTVNGKQVQFRTYTARGAAKGYLNDDGTIVPTAAGGSIPFAPEETLNALYTMKVRFNDKLYQEYGFLDAFNLTYKEEGWFNKDYIGIDQGPILIQLENLESELIWKTLRKNPYIQKGLVRAGFEGGWLDEVKK